MNFWSRRRLRLKKLARQRLVIECEPLEGRALMATMAMIATPPAVAPAIGVSIPVAPRLIGQVQAQNQALYNAFETLISDLATAIQSPAGLSGASATISHDVHQLLAAAPSTTSEAATTLTGDVTTVTTSGTLTSASSTALGADLTTVLSSAIAVPASSSGSGSGSSSSSVAAPTTAASQTPLASSFSNPNAPSTALSDVGRAQDSDLDASATNVVASPQTPTTPKKGPLGQLLGDLSGVFAKATTLAPGSKTDLRSDLVAIASTARRPSSQAVATLQSHISQFSSLAKLDANATTTLSNDLSAVLTSAGVSSRLVDRTQVDLGRVLASPQVLPSDVGTILNDLTNVLIQLPAASAGPSGPASWFLGKTPFGK